MHAARLQEMEKDTSQASASKDEVESLLRDVEQRLKAMRLTADEEGEAGRAKAPKRAG